MRLIILVVLTVSGNLLLSSMRPAPVETSPVVGLGKVELPKAVSGATASVSEITATFKAPVAKAAPQASAANSGGSKEQWMAAAGIPQSDWSCADSLITKESNWRVDAQNPSSPAYGIPQSLPGEKMASAGADWRTNPVTQLIWMKGYVSERHGGFCGAWAHSQANNWY